MFSRNNRLVDTDLQNRSSHFMVEAARKQIIASNAFQLRHCGLFRSESVCVSQSSHRTVGSEECLVV